MASINTRIRFTDMELAHGIDALLFKEYPIPSDINSIIRNLVFLGIANTLSNANYNNKDASLTSQNIVAELLTKRSSAIATKQIQKIAHNNFINPAKIKEILNKASADPKIPNKHLLNHLEGEDVTKGNCMLTAMHANTGVTLLKNISSTNKEISRIAYEMFRHSDSLTAEEAIAINKYKKENQKHENK